MPRKVFVSGEILTASDVNTNLMDQAVMRFASSAARGSAISSPTEGMVSYLDDLNQVQVFDASAWIPVSGIVDTKVVVKTDTQASSLAAGSAIAISGLSIDHAVANSSNEVILIAQINGGRGLGILAGALTAGGTMLNLGDAAGSRTRISANNRSDDVSTPSTIMLLAKYAPGSTSSITYGANIINLDSTTSTNWVNRSQDDVDTIIRPRAASVLILLEVAV